MAVGSFRNAAFTGRRPSVKKICGWIDSGEIPGEVLGGEYFVWVGPYNDVVTPPCATVSTGIEEADRLLSEYLQ